MLEPETRERVESTMVDSFQHKIKQASSILICTLEEHPPGAIDRDMAWFNQAVLGAQKEVPTVREDAAEGSEESNTAKDGEVMGVMVKAEGVQT